MSWPQPIAFPHHAVQSNAPDLHKVLKYKNLNESIQSHASEHIAMKVTIEEPVKDSNGDFQSPPQNDQRHTYKEFATPKATHAKPKIIHKEKLTTFSNVAPTKSTTTTSKVPTAHVFPSPAVRPGVPYRTPTSPTRVTTTRAPHDDTLCDPDRTRIQAWDNEPHDFHELDAEVDQSRFERRVSRDSSHDGNFNNLEREVTGSSASPSLDDGDTGLEQSSSDTMQHYGYPHNYKHDIVSHKYSSHSIGGAPTIGTLPHYDRPPTYGYSHIPSTSSSLYTRSSPYHTSSSYTSQDIHRNIHTTKDYDSSLRNVHSDTRTLHKDYSDTRGIHKDYTNSDSRLKDYGDSRSIHKDYSDSRSYDKAYGDSRVYSKDYGDSRSYNTTGGLTGGSAFSNDLTQWQQRHQDQLRRQHLESHQLYTGGTGLVQPVVNTLLIGDPHVDAVKKAADNIIKEKDSLLQKQKMKLLEYERVARDSDSEITKNLLKQATQNAEALSMRLQDGVYDSEFREMEYQKAALKDQLAQYSGGTGTVGGVTDWEKKLGAVEYEMRELKLSKDKELGSKTTQIRQLEDQLAEKEQAAKEWKQKCTAMAEQQQDLEKKMSELERYFADMPTEDEHQRKRSEIKQLREDKSRYKHKAGELERRVAESGKAIKSRDALIESLEHNESHLQEKCDKLQGEIKKVNSQIERLQGGITAQHEEEMEDLREENSRLKADCDKARKLLESKHKKLNQMEAKHRSDVSRLEERVGQEESAVTALREEITNKEHHLKKLRQSVKELGCQNQDMMEKNMLLEDKIHELERANTDDIKKLERRLVKEMSVCFHELQSLVQICVQKAEGQDPNISLLLGPKCMPVSDTEASGSDPASDKLQSLKYKVNSVKDLRKDIDKLRDLMSSKFAEEMGDNLNCTTQ